MCLTDVFSPWNQIYSEHGHTQSKPHAWLDIISGSTVSEIIFLSLVLGMNSQFQMCSSRTLSYIDPCLSAVIVKQGLKPAWHVVTFGQIIKAPLHVILFVNFPVRYLALCHWGHMIFYNCVKQVPMVPWWLNIPLNLHPINIYSVLLVELRCSPLNPLCVITCKHSSISRLENSSCRKCHQSQRRVSWSVRWDAHSLIKTAELVLFNAIRRWSQLIYLFDDNPKMEGEWWSSQRDRHDNLARGVGVNHSKGAGGGGALVVVDESLGWGQGEDGVMEKRV